MRRAIRKDDFEAFKTLLERNVDPAAKRGGSMSRTATHVAAGPNVDEKYMAAIVEETNAPLNVQRGEKYRAGQSLYDAREGDTPLHEAVRNINLPVVRQLMGADIDRGVNPQQLNWAGIELSAKTPLQLAERIQDERVRQEFIDTLRS